jgi:hypothetical protein
VEQGAISGTSLGNVKQVQYFRDIAKTACHIEDHIEGQIAGRTTMDYGIQDRVALVVASSKGLGKACAPVWHARAILRDQPSSGRASVDRNTEFDEGVLPAP